MTILVPVAHADDEIYCGASLARFAAEGHQVYVLALADGETSRSFGIDPHGVRACQAIDRRQQQHADAARLLGYHVIDEVRAPGGLRFPDQRLDAVDLLDLTRVIEKTITTVQPSVVYTHSPGDLNADHRRVYEAVLPAVRPKSGVTSVYCFEGPAMRRPFQPTTFWTITEAQLEQQHQALLCYGDELIADWPLMRARAVVYGYRVGAPLAQGFEVVREGG